MEDQTAVQYLDINGDPAAIAFTHGSLYAALVVDLDPPGSLITAIYAAVARLCALQAAYSHSKRHKATRPSDDERREQAHD